MQKKTTPKKAHATPSPTRKERRRVGRPVGESQDLRSRLLDVAVVRFGRDGVSATTLRDIAREAGVNPALVHYYFGDKAQLLEAVMAERLMPAFGEVRTAVLQSGEDVAGL